MAESIKKRATYADLEAVPPHLVAEIIDGKLVTRPVGHPRTAATIAALNAKFDGRVRKRRGGSGEWVFISRPEVHLGADIVVPDMAAWRGLTELPDTPCWTTVPDWVCEILSGSTEKRDRTLKMRIYGEAGVPHFWLIDPRLQILEAYENRSGRWTKTGDWNSDDAVRAPPFDAVSFSLADLWPLDRPLGLDENPQHLYAGDR